MFKYIQCAFTEHFTLPLTNGYEPQAQVKNHQGHWINTTTDFIFIKRDL